VHFTIVNHHPAFHLGGSEMQCDLIARQLREQGHDVRYVALRAPGAPPDVPYLVSPWDPGTSRLGDLLATEPTDVVYWRSGRQFLLRSVLDARLSGVPFIYAISGPSAVDPWWFRKAQGGLDPVAAVKSWLVRARGGVRARINWEGYRLVDGFVSNTQYLLDRLPTSSGFSRARQCIYNLAAPDATGSAEFAWPRRYVAWVANLSHIKNPEAYLDLARSARGLDVDFLVVGAVKEPAYGYFEDAQRLPENVKYLGPRSPAEVNGLLAGAEMLVHTCYPEGFSGNLIQAWAQGCPTVVLHHDPDGVIERWGAGHHAGSPGRLREACVRLLENPADRDRAASGALRLAREAFDPARNVGKLVDFARSLRRSGRTTMR
jgi:glycosyltransferase involved in cell wall biosynthesis